jgi:hypothetical protein
VTPRRSDFPTAVRELSDRLNALLHRTITAQPLVMTAAAPAADGARRMQFTFRRGGPVLAALQSQHGPLGLYVGQVCEARPLDEDGSSIVTMNYRYALHYGTDINSEPVVRWEFDRRPADLGARWSRRHLQGPIPLTFGQTTVSLNDLHLPTGHVALEDVIRFCIHDLAVPPLSADWNEILSQRYREPEE